MAFYWLICQKMIFYPKCAYISSTILTFLPNNPLCFTPKIPKKLIFPQIAPKIQGTLFTFLPKRVIFSQNAPAYRALFWLFCPIIQCVFTPKIPKKFIFPQIAPIIQGTLLPFLPKTVIVFTNACISSTILTFFPNNLLWFYTKNYQKVHFSSYYVYNTGHFIDFSPK